MSSPERRLRVGTLLLASVLALALPGCGADGGSVDAPAVTDAGPADAGPADAATSASLTFDWIVTLNGEPATCLDVEAETVSFTTTRAADGASFRGSFPCDAKTGSFAVGDGMLVTTVEVTDVSGNVLLSTDAGTQTLAPGGSQTFLVLLEF